MSGKNTPEQENETQQARYMLLGDTYADIMYAQQLIGDLPGRDTTVYDTWLLTWSDQLMEMFESIDELDDETLNEQASYVSDQVTNVIYQLEQMR